MKGEEGRQIGGVGQSVAQEPTLERIPSSFSSDFSVRRETLWESSTASDAEVSRIEVEYIRRLRSNDPKIGYNRWPRLSEALSGDGAE